MANILYRGAAAPTVTNAAGANNGPLTNEQIDKNFYALDLAKFEIAGGTITGATTFSSTVAINGNLTVAGTTTTINAINLAISDRNIELATGSTTAAGANGGGITLKGDGDKTITWDSTNANWTSSEHWNIATGKSFKINNVVVLNSTTLGSSIVNSSLTKLGTSAGFVKSDASGNLSSDTNTYLTGNQSITLSGDITGTGATAITATIANSAVTTAKIADANVTTGKLADGAATIAKGGVGFTTYAAGDIIYSNAANSLAKLNKGNDGQVLKLVSGFPAWAADNDTVYSLPLAADGTRGGVQIGFTTNAVNRNYAVQLSGEKMYVNVPWTDTDTDTNTTYSIKASAQTNGAGLDLDAGGSGSGTDTVKILGSGATTVTQTDVNTITISSTAPGNGTLSTAAVAAGATNTTVSLNLSGAYSANTTDNRTINPVVGPAITNLAALMTSGNTGFVKRTGQDTYSIDTNTYLTSYTETDTLATVTARGASTSSNITLTGSTPITLTSSSSNTITTGNGFPLTITTGSTGSSITIRPGQKTSGSGNNLTVAAGEVTTTNTNAAAGTTTITGGISTVTAGGSGGNIIIAGGYANGTSGTKNGGNVYINGGGATGAGTNNPGNVYIGTNAGSEYFTNIIQIGHNASSIRLQGLGTSGFVKLGANGTLSADTNTYLTSYTETSTLAQVLGRNNTIGPPPLTYSINWLAPSGPFAGASNLSSQVLIFNNAGPAATNISSEYKTINCLDSTGYIASIRIGNGSDRMGRIEFGNMTHWDAPFLSQTYGNGTYPIIMRASAANGASAILEVTSGDMRSPVFYEYDNTGVYLDLASTGTSLNARGKLISGQAFGVGGGELSLFGPGASIYASSTHGLTITPPKTTNEGGGISVYYAQFNTSGPGKGYQFKFDNTEVFTFDEYGSYTFRHHLRTSYGNGRKFTIIAPYTYNSVNYNTIFDAGSDINSGTPGFKFSKNTSGSINGEDVSAANLLMQVTSAGNFTASGNVTAYSDARLKTNIKTLENSLEKTLKLRGVSYQKDGKDGIGVVAQEIRKVLPEVVMEGDDPEKTLSVAYGNVVGVLIEAIKELNAKVEDLQKQLANK